MNVRGRPLVVLVDGVRLNSSRTDSRQLDSIDPFNIDHIEVISVRRPCTAAAVPVA